MVQMAVSTMMCLPAYLMSGEGLGLIWSVVIEPAPGISTQWAITIRPEERQAGTKVSARDDTSLLCISCVKASVGPWMRVLSNGQGHERLSSFTHPGFLKELNAVGRLLVTNKHHQRGVEAGPCEAEVSPLAPPCQ